MDDEKIVIVCENTEDLGSKCNCAHCYLCLLGRCALWVPIKKEHLNKGDVVTIEIKRNKDLTK